MYFNRYILFCLEIFRITVYLFFIQGGIYMISVIERVNSAVNGVIWGVPALVLLIGTGVIVSFLTKFFQGAQESCRVACGIMLPWQNRM